MIQCMNVCAMCVRLFCHLNRWMWNIQEARMQWFDVNRNDRHLLFAMICDLLIVAANSLLQIPFGNKNDSVNSDKCETSVDYQKAFQLCERLRYYFHKNRFEMFH